LVNNLLGTPSDERLLEVLAALVTHEPARALLLVEESAGLGVQPLELLSGLIDFVRDALVLAVGAESMLLAVSPRQRPDLKRIVALWPLDSIQAALQIFSECRARMRGSLHSRFLLELALVRVARLEDLAELASLVDRLDALESGAPMRKAESAQGVRRVDPHAVPTAPAVAFGALGEPATRTPIPAPSAAAHGPAPPPMPVRVDPVLVARPQPAASNSTSPPSAGTRPPQTAAPFPPSERPDRVVAQPMPEEPSLAVEAAPTEHGPESPTPAGREELAPVDLATARKAWPDLVKKVGASLGWRLSQVEPVAVVGSDVLVIAAKPGYNSVADACGDAEALVKIEQSLQRLIHRPVNVKYERSADSENVSPEPRPGDSRRGDAISSDPMVQKVVELFEARSLKFEYDDEAPSS
jgi:DNA polymerase-3 subunit gamma/tau